MGACDSTNKDTLRQNREQNQNNQNNTPISKNEKEINMNEINIEVNPDDSKLKNKNLNNNDKKLKERKEEEEDKKYYLICPLCKVRFPYITSIDQNKNIITITFKCICNKSENEASINEMIFETKPNNLCPLHQSSLNLFCSTCNYFICINCKDEHQEHFINDNNDNKNYIDCDIDQLIKNLSIQQLDFEAQCTVLEKECENKIIQEIDKLNQIKQKVKKSFNEQKNDNKKIFKMLNTLFLEYKELNNNENNNIDKNNIMISNQLENFDLQETPSTEQLTTNINEILSNINNTSIPFYLNYPINFKQLNNIEFNCKQTLFGHNDKIVSLIKLHSGNLASGSYDNTIRIWDLQKCECKLVINEEGYVLCLLEFIPNFILTGLSDNKIKLYNISDNYKLIHCFEGHTLWVNCLVKINDEKFASGSNDSNIKIWDYLNKQEIATLKGHTDCILSLIILQNQNLCSGSADNTIRIWDYEKYECLYILNGHEKWVKCLFQLDNGLIISGSDDKTIKVWKDLNCIETLKGHNHSVRTLCQINKKYFASGSFDGTIKIWDIQNFTIKQTLNGHNSNVIGIVALNNKKIASCSNDHTIKIWN